MKRFVLLLISVCILICMLVPCVAAIDVVEPTEEGYVADYANILSDETETMILEKGAQVDAYNGSQLVVVTLDYLGREDIEDYAYSLYNQWGIGDADRDNGLLLLISSGDQSYWVTLGKGVDDVISTESLSDLFYDYFDPQFDTGDYDAAVASIYPRVTDLFMTSYSQNSNDGYNSDSQELYNRGYGNYSTIGATASLIVILVIIVVIVIIAASISRRPPGSGGGRGGPRIFIFGRPWGYFRPRGFWNPGPGFRPGNFGGGFGKGGSSGAGGFGRSGFGGFGGGGSRGGGFGKR